MKKVIFLSALVLSSNVFARDVIGIVKEIKPFYTEKTEISPGPIVSSYSEGAGPGTGPGTAYNMQKFLDSIQITKVEDKEFKLITLEAEDKTVYTLKMSSDFDVKVGEKIKTNIENL
jgi:hypothetical protein